MHAAAHGFVEWLRFGSGVIRDGSYHPERLADEIPAWKDTPWAGWSYFVNSRVLEVGSFDINGSVRDLFERSTFFGVDRNDGSNVDTVGWFHLWAAEHLKRLALLRMQPHYDVVFSTECLEHDPHAELTVKAMIDCCAKGGLIFLTCAGPGREVHCLETTGHYKNITRQELEQWFADKGETVSVMENSVDHDLYAWCVKAV